jgi:hypothetical protein
MVHRSYRQRPTYAQQMALKKKADQYVARDGQAPSVYQARKDGRAQDLNADDRSALKWALIKLRVAVANQGDATQCLEFVEAILDNIYQLNPKSAERRQDQSHQVGPDEDPELYAWLMRHQR